MHPVKSHEKTVNRQQVWANLLRILSVRLAILSLVLAAAGVLLPRQDGSFGVLMALAFVLIIPYGLWIKEHVRQHDLAQIQFLADMVLTTGLVYFTGGLHSPLVLLYPLVIVAAGLVTPARVALQVTVLGIFLYFTMGVLTLQNILIPLRIPVRPVAPASEVVTMLLHGITFAVFGIISAFLSKRCLYLTPEDLARDLTHWRTAANLASEMAHEVRNPVAAISGSAQVLSHLEKRSSRGDEESQRLLVAERDRLFHCIVDESDRLDRIMEKFLNHAEYSEDRLIRLIHLRETEGFDASDAAAEEPASEKIAS